MTGTTDAQAVNAIATTAHRNITKAISHSESQPAAWDRNAGGNALRVWDVEDVEHGACDGHLAYVSGRTQPSQSRSETSGCALARRIVLLHIVAEGAVRTQELGDYPAAGRNEARRLQGIGNPEGWTPFAISGFCSL